MAEVERTPLKQRLQMAGAIVGSLLVINTIFLISSRFYYADKPLLAANAGEARLAFGVMTFSLAAAAYLAALAPRLVGHALAGVMAVASIVGGIAVLTKDLPPVMGITMLVIGALLPALIWKSLQHSRPAWSFLIAIVAVLAAVTFFGAPKVSNLLGIGLWTSLVIPGLQSVCVIALSMLRREYRD